MKVSPFRMCRHLVTRTGPLNTCFDHRLTDLLCHTRVGIIPLTTSHSLIHNTHHHHHGSYHYARSPSARGRRLHTCDSSHHTCGGTPARRGGFPCAKLARRFRGTQVCLAYPERLTPAHYPRPPSSPRLAFLQRIRRTPTQLWCSKCSRSQVRRREPLSAPCDP